MQKYAHRKSFDNFDLFIFSACHSLVENLKTESRRQRKASWFSIPNPEDRKNRKTDDQKFTKNYQTTEKAKKHKTE